MGVPKTLTPDNIDMELFQSEVANYLNKALEVNGLGGMMMTDRANQLASDFLRDYPDALIHKHPARLDSSHYLVSDSEGQIHIGSNAAYSFYRLASSEKELAFQVVQGWMTDINNTAPGSLGHAYSILRGAGTEVGVATQEFGTLLLNIYENGADGTSKRVPQPVEVEYTEEGEVGQTIYIVQPDGTKSQYKVLPADIFKYSVEATRLVNTVTDQEKATLQAQYLEAKKRYDEARAKYATAKEVYESTDTTIYTPVNGGITSSEKDSRLSVLRTNLANAQRELKNSKTAVDRSTAQLNALKVSRTDAETALSNARAYRESLILGSSENVTPEDAALETVNEPEKVAIPVDEVVNTGNDTVKQVTPVIETAEQTTTTDEVNSQETPSREETSNIIINEIPTASETVVEEAPILDNQSDTTPSSVSEESPATVPQVDSEPSLSEVEDKSVFGENLTLDLLSSSFSHMEQVTIQSSAIIRKSEDKTVSKTAPLASVNLNPVSSARQIQTYSRVTRAQAEKTLPNTGETSSMLSLIGLGLSGLGLVELKRKRG